MDGSHVRGSLCGQVVQLDGIYSLINTRNDSLGNCNGIDMSSIESITKSLDSSSDFVEPHGFLASVALINVHGGVFKVLKTLGKKKKRWEKFELNSDDASAHKMRVFSMKSTKHL